MRPYLSGGSRLSARVQVGAMPVMEIFGGTTEIQKEIIARSLGL
jgi:alkylation response protein AidB-like acyl-CoA dehydrogenase